MGQGSIFKIYTKSFIGLLHRTNLILRYLNTWLDTWINKYYFDDNIVIQYIKTE